MDFLDGDIRYVVKFENGQYFKGSFSSEKETDQLNRAAKYIFDWQPLKDLQLQRYVYVASMEYELIKVKTKYEIVECDDSVSGHEKNTSELEDKVKLYQKALSALLSLSAETDQGVLVDIITDALTGHELMDQYEQHALEGSVLLAQYVR